MLLGSGWLGDTYVDYGLGNFLWYHDHQPETGVLRLTVRDGEVVGDSWTPGADPDLGRPLPLRGERPATAVADWRRLRRGCTGLAPRRRATRLDRRTPRSSIERIDAVPAPADAQQPPRRLSGARGADLRYLRLTYVGFDGRAHTGELVVHGDYAREVVGVFRTLYDARWPIRRMRLVDDYGGDDDRSMAADNTSGFNCRRVAGSRSWSAHAFGAAIDINPVQNPDLTGSSVAPPGSRRFATLDRAGRSARPRRHDQVRRCGGQGVRRDRLGVGRVVGGARLPALLGDRSVALRSRHGARAAGGHC